MPPTEVRYAMVEKSLERKMAFTLLAKDQNFLQSFILAIVIESSVDQGRGKMNKKLLMKIKILLRIMVTYIRYHFTQPFFILWQ